MMGFAEAAPRRQMRGAPPLALPGIFMNRRKVERSDTDAVTTGQIGKELPGHTA